MVSTAMVLVGSLSPQATNPRQGGTVHGLVAQN